MKNGKKRSKTSKTETGNKDGPIDLGGSLKSPPLPPALILILPPSFLHLRWPRRRGCWLLCRRGAPVVLNPWWSRIPNPIGRIRRERSCQPGQQTILGGHRRCRDGEVEAWVRGADLKGLLGFRTRTGRGGWPRFLIVLSTLLGSRWSCDWLRRGCWIPFPLGIVTMNGRRRRPLLPVRRLC